MQIHLESKTRKNKFIYGDIQKSKKPSPLVIFLSGFSGSKELPLFKNAANVFLRRGFSTLRLNFCNDNEDKNPHIDALDMKDLSFSVYSAELKNIIDLFRKKYQKIVLVGHSFGAVASILFLNKHRDYLMKVVALVLWDPTLLPWKKEWMEEDFIFDPQKKIYRGRNKGEIMSKVFYGECINTQGTDKILKNLSVRTCIIAAQGSADTDAKQYFSKIKNKEKGKLVILKKADHFFKGEGSKRRLFKETINFIKLQNS